jgi:hypothetical protein
MLRAGLIDTGAILANCPRFARWLVEDDDRPTEFADATLVRLPSPESLSLILTIVHADFEAHRIGARKRFSILPRRLLK